MRTVMVFLQTVVSGRTGNRCKRAKSRNRSRAGDYAYMKGGAGMINGADIL